MFGEEGESVERAFVYSLFFRFFYLEKDRLGSTFDRNLDPRNSQLFFFHLAGIVMGGTGLTVFLVSFHCLFFFNPKRHSTPPPPPGPFLSYL